MIMIVHQDPRITFKIAARQTLRKERQKIFPIFFCAENRSAFDAAGHDVMQSARDG
jgi:hypothetical protein